MKPAVIIVSILFGVAAESAALGMSLAHAARESRVTFVRRFSENDGSADFGVLMAVDQDLRFSPMAQWYPAFQKWLPVYFSRGLIDEGALLCVPNLEHCADEQILFVDLCTDRQWSEIVRQKPGGNAGPETVVMLKRVRDRARNNLGVR